MLARLLFVVLAATQASGLVIAGQPAACPAAAVRSSGAARMALPSIDDATKLSDEEIAEEIFNAKKVWHEQCWTHMRIDNVTRTSA